MNKTSRRSQLLAQLQGIDKRYTSGKAIGNLLTVSTTASLHSIAFLEASIKHLGYEPIAAPVKGGRGWIKGRARLKPGQEAVLAYCASLPIAEYSVREIVEGCNQSRSTVVTALGLKGARITWCGTKN